MLNIVKNNIIIIILFGVFMGCSSQKYIDKRRESSNFKKGKFHNSKKGGKGFWEFIKSRSKTEYSKWPEWIKTDYVTKPKKIVTNNEIKITVINHATVLIQTNEYNIITDPIYSDRCSPVSFAGPKRVRNPAIKFSDLPKIDIILISHDHYDHLDIPTIKRIFQNDKPKIYTGLGVGINLAYIEDIRNNFIEMDWWEKKEISKKLKIHFVPVQHFSGRGLLDRMSTLWGGFVIEFGDKKIYFGGDSGYGEHYKETYKRFGKMNVSILPIGAYKPRDFMGFVHMDPKEAIQAHVDLHSEKSIAIHYGTFQLTAEKINEPVTLLKKESKNANLKEDDFIAPEFGTSITIN